MCLRGAVVPWRCPGCLVVPSTGELTQSQRTEVRKVPEESPEVRKVPEKSPELSGGLLPWCPGCVSSALGSALGAWSCPGCGGMLMYVGRG